MPRSDVERTALDRVPGAGPVRIERLAAGLVSESYLVERGGERYSLRVPVSEATGLGVDREWECRVLAGAAALGLAPRIECCEPQCGILLARWVQGRAWTTAESALEASVEKMATLMRRVHGLPIPAAPRLMSPKDWIDCYRAGLSRGGADPKGSAALPRLAAPHLAALAALPSDPPVLCHSDLHVQNLVETGHGLVLLDWEYAHVTDANWDLAGWICNNDLSDDCGRFLLSRYLGRRPSGEQEARLGHLRWLYDYVCLLWIELYLRSSGSRDSGGLESRAAFLTARLKDS